MSSNRVGGEANTLASSVDSATHQHGPVVHTASARMHAGILVKPTIRFKHLKRKDLSPSLSLSLYLPLASLCPISPSLSASLPPSLLLLLSAFLALSLSYCASLSWSSAAMCGVCACICVSTTVLDLLCGLLELRMNSNSVACSVACSVWIAGRRFLAPVASQRFHLIKTGIYATSITNLHLK